MLQLISALAVQCRVIKLVVRSADQNSLCDVPLKTASYHQTLDGDSMSPLSTDAEERKQQAEFEAQDACDIAGHCQYQAEYSGCSDVLTRVRQYTEPIGYQSSFSTTFRILTRANICLFCDGKSLTSCSPRPYLVSVRYILAVSRIFANLTHGVRSRWRTQQQGTETPSEPGSTISFVSAYPS